MAAGKLNKEGRSGSLGADAAAGATAVAVGARTAVVIGPGLGALAVASATVVLLPFAVVGRAWGIAKMKRAKKEAAIKKVISGCLQERGYSVADWVMVTKKRRTAAAVATNRSSWWSAGMWLAWRPFSAGNAACVPK